VYLHFLYAFVVDVRVVLLSFIVSKGKGKGKGKGKVHPRTGHEGPEGE